MAKQTVIVSVLADTKKFSRAMKNLSNEIGLTKLGNGFKTAGSKIVGFFKSGIKWAGAFVAAMVALALKGGFDRMMNIENAQAKLKGLGHDAKTVTAVMDDALASVKGTAFGLDSAATAAASAMAAGIKPGAELQKYITRLADSATIAGTSMDDMSAIYGKIATANRAQTTEINQIADRGIPIWAKLAEQYGVSQTELRKMVSAGKVDAQSFYEAMDELVGGAALTAGDTTAGAFANMRAALSRVGAAFLTTIFPMFKTALQGITGWLDTVTDRIGPLGEAAGKWISDRAVPAVQNLARWVTGTLVPALSELWSIVSGALRTAIDTLSGALSDAGASAGAMGASIGDKVIAALKVLGPILAKVIKAIGDLVAWAIRSKDILIPLAVAITALVTAWAAFNKVMRIARAVQAAFNVAMTMNPIGLVIAAVAALVAGLVWFFTQTETGRKIVTTAWEGIQAAVAAVVDWWQTYVQPVLSTVWEAITAAGTAAADWYNTNVAPLFEAAGELLAAIFERIGAVVGWLWNNAFKPYLNLIAGLWKGVWSGVQAVWKAIGPGVMTAIKGAIETLKIIWSGIWNAVKAVFVGVWNGIKNTVNTVLGVIKGVIKTATAVIRGDWSGAWNAIKATLSTILTGMVNAVRNAIRTIGNVFGTIKNTVMNVFRSAGSWLLDAGRKIVSGLIDGLKGGFNKVKDTLSNLTSLLPDWKGPERRDKTLLTQSGKWIIDGLNDGLASEFGAVRKNLTNLTKTIAGTDLGQINTAGAVTLDLTATPLASPAGTAAPRANIVINLSGVITNPVETGRQIKQALRDYERMGGVA